MIDGALLVDKPVGVTSNFALQKVKRLLEAAKAGHAGTLDPLASGLLIALFGEATKFAGLLLESDKEYLATVKLGETTATGDAEGEVLEQKEVSVTGRQVDEALTRFQGEIEQVPPMHSALKRDGVPLYKLARRGESVERLPRRVRILERTGSGRFRVDDAVPVAALETMAPPERRGRVIGLEALLVELPRVDLDAALAAKLRNGQSLSLQALSEGVSAVYGPDGALIGIGRAEAGTLHPLRLTQAAEKG